MVKEGVEERRINIEQVDEPPWPFQLPQEKELEDEEEEEKDEEKEKYDEEEEKVDEEEVNREEKDETTNKYHECERSTYLYNGIERTIVEHRINYKTVNANGYR